ncbi:GntR family transcriptional regulator [Mycetohabitans endofungorum]|uniref:GntR family transcriptional regulator n=1 Tax=Mycetohabitans endofungorum TaxID=417203 RepID=UPI0030CB3A26
MDIRRLSDTRTPSLVEHIVDRLRERIVSGELAGGTALRQDHIAKEFGASHVPVREAFQRLQAIGLVTILHRRGVRVTALDRAAIKEAVDMRAVLEPLALRHAMPHLRAEHFEALESAHAACDAANSLASWDAANRAFHHALVRHCAMPRLLATLDVLQLTSSRFVLAVGRARGWQSRSNYDHQLIIDALKGHDLERAAQLLSRHIGTMERVGFPVS